MVSQFGAVSFGGGYGMISLIRERVLANGWLTESQLLNLIAATGTQETQVPHVDAAQYSSRAAGSQCGRKHGAVTAQAENHLRLAEHRVIHRVASQLVGIQPSGSAGIHEPLQGQKTVR